MKLSRWLLAAAALLAATLAVSAQVPYFGNPYGGFSYSRGRVSVGVGFGGPVLVARSSYYGMFAPPPPPVIVIRRTIYIERPPREQDDYPPPPPPRRREGPMDPPPPEIPPVPDVPPVPDIPPMPGEPPPLPLEEKKLIPLPPPRPRPKPPADGEPALPRAPEPFDDPELESRRQMDLGREDFIDRQYGRAAQRFRRAMALRPRDGLPVVLLAQALLASAKYHEASDAIVTAVRLWPELPGAAFRPLDVYGPDVVSYTEHLREVERLRDRHPADAALMFVAGYQAWMDGRRDEAAGLFRGLAGRFDAPTLERFLRALPAGGPL